MTEFVTIARLNNLQSRIALILGNGSGDRGYGQTLTSAQVANSSTTVVRAEDINKIFIDLIKARIHQVGYNAFISSNLIIAEVLGNTSSIGLESSPNVVVNSQTGVASLVDDIQNSVNISSFRGISDYEKLMDQIEIDKFVANSTQMTVELGTQSVRTNPWNKDLYFEFFVNFKDMNHRRHFFNSGGKIFVNSSFLNASTLKSRDWAAFLSSVGTISFNHSETTGPHTGTLIGNYDLTSTYQTVYQRIGSGTVYGIYSGNLFILKAKEVSATTIAFRVEYSDVAQDGNVDDVVQGRLECTINQLLPDGSFDYNGISYSSVVLPSPVYSIITGLDTFAAPNSIFSLTTSKSAVSPNESFKITLNTLNIPSASQIPYTITGVNSVDIGNQNLSDAFVVSRNNASKTFVNTSPSNQDTVFTLKLNGLPNTVTVNFNRTPQAVSANRTCISVMDESSLSSGTIRNSWLTFRSRWPNRPFYLLQPGSTKTTLKIPAEFNRDPIAFYSSVARDNAVESSRSDWYSICNLQNLPDGSKIAIFIDTSGSMNLNTVKASYDLLIQKLAQRNMSVITVQNGIENWIQPFDQILD